MKYILTTLESEKYCSHIRVVGTGDITCSVLKGKYSLLLNLHTSRDTVGISGKSS
uniref:Uncharacterized protein n=1 Tax=Arundo donax TaxID=35708 RepID=A0A0A8YRF6_ARUDO